MDDMINVRFRRKTKIVYIIMPRKLYGFSVPKCLVCLVALLLVIAMPGLVWSKTGGGSLVSKTDFELPLVASNSNFSKASPPWKLAIDGNSYSVSVKLHQTDSDHVCADIRTFYNVNDRALGVQEKEIKNTYGVGSSVDINECEAIKSALKFRVYIQSEDKVSSKRFLVDSSSVTLPGGSLEGLIWRLQKKDNGKWVDIGGYNSGNAFGASTWIGEGASYALLLVDEKSPPVIQPVITERAGSPSAAVKKLRRESVVQMTAFPDSGRLDYAGQTARLPIGYDLPVLELGKNESSKSIFVQVVPGLENSLDGSICLRFVYLSEADRVKYFEKKAKSYVTTNGTYSLGDSGQTDCSSQPYLAFPVFLRGKPNIVKSGFLVTVPSSKKINLRDIKIKLVDRKTRSINSLSMDGRGRENSSGYWIEYGSNQYAAYLTHKSESKKIRIVLETQNAPIEEPPFFANGRPVDNNALILESGRIESLQVGYPAIELPKSIRVCVDIDCDTKPLRILRPEANPFELLKENIVSDSVPISSVYLVFDWNFVDTNVRTDPEIKSSQKTIVSKSLVVESQLDTFKRPDYLVFEPTVSFGEYTKSLTSCLGRLVSPDVPGFSSKTFSLKEGLQRMELVPELNQLTEETQVKVVYDQGRGGGPCPVPGLETELNSFSSLVAEGSEENKISHDLPVNASLFLGYLHLGRKKLNRSRARWNDFLVFFDKAYQIGRDKGAWQDGIVIGRTKSSSDDVLLMPRTNFPSRLADKSTLDSLAGKAAGSSLPNIFFDEFLEEYKEVETTGRTKLFYYDGQAESCEEYRKLIEDMEIQFEQVIIVASFDDYSPSNYSVARTLGNDELLSVCFEDRKHTVYGLNGQDIEGSRQWPAVFGILLQDLKKIL